jgi:monovalent cation:proton antiporter-2 (CPA2) family protein
MTDIGLIVIILIASTLCGSLFTRFNLPAVVGQLLVGIVLGPAVLNIIQPTHSIEFIAEVGVIFLMFIAGLESDTSLLAKYFKPAVLVAVIGVLLPLGAFYGLASVLDYSFEQSVFLGIVYAATSVSITVQVLQDYNKLQTKEGATILGAAVVDDVIAVLLLSFFLTVFGLQGDSHSDHPASFIGQLAMQLAFVVILVVAIKWLVPFVMHLFDELPMFASGTLGAVIFCLGLAYLADLFGFSDVIGAFFAGVAVAQAKQELVKRLEHSVAVVAYSFFIPVFFASIGLGMSFTDMAAKIPMLLLMTVIAVATKLFGGMLAARMSGFSWASGYTIGAGMVSRGEMALIVAQIGFASKLINSGIYSELVLVIIATTILAPFLIKHSLKYLTD